jgi:2-polyprenyl-6-methoxyphenol hydroxylase-like FAD-dependent oxidoreductase
MTRLVEIIGGGLAGLSLGLALQRRGVATTIFEAGDYPRHRVCGEFIAGLHAPTIEALGLREILADAKPLSEVAWFSRGTLLRRQHLLQPALALSRWELDQRLAQAFRDAGGKLETHCRIEDSTTPEGRIFATGRARQPSPWLGLKLHARRLVPEGELEFHLGRDGYVGLSAVEKGWINICGLFRRRAGLTIDRESALIAYLRAADLGELARRLEKAEIDSASYSAVAGFGFGRAAQRGNETAAAHASRIELGDCFAMIPPYTGNGMAIAFQTAECALAPVRAWARDERGWSETVQLTMNSIHRRLDRRLALADRLHGFMLEPFSQKLFQLAHRSGLLPFRRLAAFVHA